MMGRKPNRPFLYSSLIILLILSAASLWQLIKDIKSSDLLAPVEINIISISATLEVYYDTYKEYPNRETVLKENKPLLSDQLTIAFSKADLPDDLQGKLPPDTDPTLQKNKYKLLFLHKDDKISNVTVWMASTGNKIEKIGTFLESPAKSNSPPLRPKSHDHRNINERN